MFKILFRRSKPQHAAHCNDAEARKRRLEAEASASEPASKAQKTSEASSPHDGGEEVEAEAGNKDFTMDDMEEAEDSIRRLSRMVQAQKAQEDEAAKREAEAEAKLKKKKDMHEENFVKASSTVAQDHKLIWEGEAN